MIKSEDIAHATEAALAAAVDRRSAARMLAVPVLLASLAACGASVVRAKTRPDAGALRAELEPRYRFYEKSFDDKSAEAFVADFYTNDVVAVSEGQGYTSGSADMLTLVRALMRDTKRIRVAWHQPQPLGPDAAFDLVQNEVLGEGESGTVSQYKSMLIWRRVNGVWQVAADFYAEGDYRA